VIIVAQRLTTNGSDQDALAPLLAATAAALGHTPRKVSATPASAGKATSNRSTPAASGVISPPAAPATTRPTRAAAAGSSPTA
jgi:hypothetical protein